MKTTVILADDHALVRAGLRMMLEASPEIAVLGEAQDGLKLLELVSQLRPQLVLVDIAMPRLNGLEAAERIVKDFSPTRVIILSMHLDEEYVRQALKVGASGYLIKDSAPAELALAIEAVNRGETYLSPAASKGVLSDYVNRLRSDQSPGSTLTPRLRQVLKLIAEGNTTKQIAQHLGLSVKTVDTHRTLLMRQLDIHDVAGLVRYAMREGLL